MSALEIAQQLLDLCVVPAHQLHIIRDRECLQGLVNFLSHDNDQVVHLSLKSLTFLSKSHPLALLEVPSLVTRARHIHSRYTDSPLLVATSGELLTSLGVTPGGPAHREFFVSLHENENWGGFVGGGGSGNGDGFGRENVERELLRVKGVVSVTRSMNKGVWIVVAAAENGLAGCEMVAKVEEAVASSAGVGKKRLMVGDGESAIAKRLAEDEDRRKREEKNKESRVNRFLSKLAFW
jgi:hypothetical protein